MSKNCTCFQATTKNVRKVVKLCAEQRFSWNNVSKK